MAIYKVINQSKQYCDPSARKDVLAYCLQDKKTPSRFITSRSVDIEHAASEMTDVAAAYGKDTQLRLRHSVLGFSSSDGEDISGCEAAEIAQKVLDFYGDQYQIVAAVHEDTDTPHIHFVMNAVSFRDGSKYRGEKKDYYAFGRYMKKILSNYGVKTLRMTSQSSSDCPY